MTGAEKIIYLMRQQGQKEAGKGLQLARMKNSVQCLVGDLVLDREDYLKADHLSLKEGDMVAVYRLDAETYVILAKVV